MLVLSSDPWTGTNWYLVEQYWRTDLDTTMKSIIFSVYILRRTNLASCLGRQGKKICDKLKYCREKVFLYKVFFSNLAVNCCKIKPPGLKNFLQHFRIFWKCEATRVLCTSFRYFICLLPRTERRPELRNTRNTSQRDDR